jgi:site-specific DNA-methyltransferase (adenine-specific)
MKLKKVIQGDCLEVMKDIPDKSIDMILTDPPYGVNYPYVGYDDTQENLKKLVDAFMPEVLRIGKVVLITCGNGNQHLYPKPDWTLAWVMTAGAGQNKWGFTCWQPILAYGKNPYRANRMGARPDIIVSNERSEKNGHACPKPIKVWEQILLKGSVKETDIILDPFAGSGTTGVACKNLNRNFILIEKEPEYVKLAEERIRAIPDKLL